MNKSGALDLAALCAEVAAELGDVSIGGEGDAVTYRRGEADFVRVTTSVLEVRLPADIAEAALRTPGTSAGSESGWIRFAPDSAERHATDRAAAWFQTAWRHAG